MKNTIEKLENTLAESRKEYKSKSKVLKEKILELEASLEVQTGIAKEVSTMKVIYYIFILFLIYSKILTSSYFFLI